MNTQNPVTTKSRHRGVTLLIVLAMMVMFAMLVTTFMVIVSQNRQTSELAAKILVSTPTRQSGGGTGIQGIQGLQEDGELDIAFQRLLTGKKERDIVIAPHSILENLYGTPQGIPFGGTGVGYDEASEAKALLSRRDGENGDGKPFALRPNILAPDSDGVQRYKKYLENNNVQMNSDYTAPDYMTMFLAWNDFREGELKGIIPSFHRPQLVRYWNEEDPNELRKYVLRPLPTDHPAFTGRNPAATRENLQQFLTEGPWDVDNDGDGRADGIWLDIGLEVQYDEASDSYYKPLVSYYVLDMDGRINVNTTGNLQKTTEPSEAMGMGLGAAELYSELLTKKVLEERYGSNKKPGGTNNDLLIKNGTNFSAYMAGGLVTDWFGTKPIEFDELGNRKMVETPAQPDDIPYLMNPYSDANGDKPFNEDDLDSLLRSVMDTDYAKLPHTFRELLEDPYDSKKPVLPLPKLRYSLTTQSTDLPVAAINHLWTEDGYVTLEEHVRSLDGTGTLWNLLPEELREGNKVNYKVNLNRLTLQGGWMDRENTLLKEKARFAQEIFYLLRVLFYEYIDNPATLERFAQWSVNLVDFIDPDDVMTPFIFNTALKLSEIEAEDFDCTPMIERVIGGQLTNEDRQVLADKKRMLIWGMEKSEVVLTETLAVHDRKVRRTDGVVLAPDYVQPERPQGSLFVELYRQGNEEHHSSASSLIELDNTGTPTLNLAKKTSSGDYVWRLAIGEATKTRRGEFKWSEGDKEKNALYQLLTPEGGAVKYPQFYQWSEDGTASDEQYQYRPDLGTPERYVWFGSEFPSDNAEIKRRSFVNTNGSDVALAPDSLLVIAPREVTTFTNPAVKIDVPEIQAADPTRVKTMIAANPDANIFAPDGTQSQGLGINASEPLPTQTLGDGYGTIPPSSNASPFDNGTNGKIPRQFGTVLCYKTICLQRLADPNRPHDSICNPYITVDWNMIDLQVINSDATQATERADSDVPVGAEYFVSRQWNQKTSSDLTNIWDRTLEAKALENDGKAGLQDSKEPVHTFGQFDYSEIIHFPWNDAPLMNSGELMLVPASAPGRFGVEFHDNGKDNDFFGDKPRFGYHDVPNANAYLDWKGSDMPRWFDFVHVPSRFTGAITSKREPGKINLNTLTEEGWESLRNGRDNFPSYTQFREYRQWQGNSDDYPSEFRPFRSPSAINLVPPLESAEDALVAEPANVTLLGLGSENGGKSRLIDDTAGNPYTVLENVARLSDVTTTRSNVFAIWITVGYFQVEKVGSLADLKEKYVNHDFSHITSDEMFRAVYPDGYVLGDDEMGIDDGTVRRFRASYLIDRSILIPTEFQHGLDVNEVNDLIHKKTILESEARGNRNRDDSATTTPSPL